MKVEELNDLKYRDLQKLAKDNGVKANLPKAGLITALVEFFEKDMDTTLDDSIIETNQEENISEPIAQLSPEKEEIVTQNVPIFESETKSETIQEEETHSNCPEINDLNNPIATETSKEFIEGSITELSKRKINYNTVQKFNYQSGATGKDIGYVFGAGNGHAIPSNYIIGYNMRTESQYTGMQSRTLSGNSYNSGTIQKEFYM